MDDRVVITYLELPPGAPLIEPSRPAPEGFAVRKVEDPAINRDMYRGVGGDYQWVDRLTWSDERWGAYVARVETYVVELDGRAAGYYEIELDDDRLRDHRDERERLYRPCRDQPQRRHALHRDV